MKKTKGDVSIMYKMVYIEIAFKAKPFSYDLKFNDRFTLVGGDSGVGKTVLFNMLDDLKLTERFNAIRLFNYKSLNVEAELSQCRNCFIVIDNADIVLTDSIKHFMNFEFTNQYMLFLRNCDGLFLSEDSFKILQEKDNQITLERGF